MDTTQTSSDQRTAARFDTHLPLKIEGDEVQTQNISAHGVYFETSAPHEVGALVNFTVEYTLYGRTHRLLCEGKVVRVDIQPGGVGVAARLLAPFFSGVEEVPEPSPRAEPSR
jgi:hypothetical protein